MKILIILFFAVMICGCAAPKAVQDLQEAQIHAIIAYQTKYSPSADDKEYQELGQEIITSGETMLRWLKGGE